MNKTTYYNLPIYEPNDPLNLIDGYNKAVIAVDAAMHALQNENDILKQRVTNLEAKITKEVK